VSTTDDYTLEETGDRRLVGCDLIRSGGKHKKGPAKHRWPFSFVLLPCGAGYSAAAASVVCREHFHAFFGENPVACRHSSIPDSWRDCR